MIESSSPALHAHAIATKKPAIWISRWIEDPTVRISIVASYAFALVCLTHANLKGTLLDQAGYPEFSLLDKVFHFGSYAVLTYLALALLGNSKNHSLQKQDSNVICVNSRAHTRGQQSFLGIAARNAVVWSLLIVCFGGIDEITQPYFGRCCDIFDWLADVIGIAMANVAYIYQTKR